MYTPCTPPGLSLFYRGLPGNYPILHTFSQGEREELCAEDHTLRHTLEERRALRASYP